MSYTESYCDPVNGSNLSAGSANAAPVYSGVGDSDGTSQFTPSDGSTPANTVSVGMFASIYVTAGATVAVFIGRITAVAAGVNGAITVSTTAKCGTIPTNSSGAHTITCVVGGYWKGPNGAVSFPIGFITGALTNSAGDLPRVTLLNSATYSITAAMTHAISFVTFQGATSTPGDGGKATIDGGTSGTSYILFTLSAGGDFGLVADMIFQHNGATGTATGVAFSCQVFRCVVNNVRGIGFGNQGCSMVECEAYACNLANDSTDRAGFYANSRFSQFVRCYSHDHVGTHSHGFGVLVNSASAHMFGCIADTCGGKGVLLTGAGGELLMESCDIYNCTSDGINIGGGTSNNYLAMIENCNFVKNGGYGINGNTTGKINGAVNNCGFGSGTQVNTSGQTNTLSGLQVSGSVTYASGVTPWVAPTTGNFTINLAAAQGTGRGSFTETDGTNTGTSASLDIGAGQHAGSGSGGGTPVLQSGILQGLGAV